MMASRDEQVERAIARILRKHLRGTDLAEALAWLKAAASAMVQQKRLG
jgi:hypothetical protein